MLVVGVSIFVVVVCLVRRTFIHPLRTGRVIVLIPTICAWVVGFGFPLHCVDYYFRIVM